MNRLLFTLLLLAIGGFGQAQSVSEKLDAYCKAFEATGKFHGTVQVKQNGQSLLSSGYGYANVEQKTRGNDHTVYQVGSITKQFTATVILKLQEQGKLSLSDKLSKFYPSFPNGDKVTVEHLLTHTSGIKSYTGVPDIFDSIKTIPVTEAYMVKLIASFPFDFEPGTRWSYSNSAYSLLGYIIEKVTGRSYEQNVREIILQPLGMSHSGFDFKNLKDTKATGYYQVTSDQVLQAKLVDSTVSYAAGSLYTTPSDLSKWNSSLYSGKIISQKSMANAHTARMNKNGLGWFIDTIHSKRVIHHGGGIDGFLCQNYVIPEAGIEVTVLGNVGSYDPGKFTTDLLGIMLGQQVDLPKPRTGIDVDDTVLKQYEGDYELQPGMVASFMVKEGKLFVDTHHDPIQELLPKTENIFSFTHMEAELEFIKGPTGKVEKFVFRQGDMTREAKKIK
jgi:CubicO group peptidase (beta-lactamase class C family)